MNELLQVVSEPQRKGKTDRKLKHMRTQKNVSIIAGTPIVPLYGSPDEALTAVSTASSEQSVKAGDN